MTDMGVLYVIADCSLLAECPYPLCAEVLDGIEHFKSHFATVHGVNL